MSDLVIGIDLGAKNSRVCLYIDGRTIVLGNKKNEASNEALIPSFMYFKPDGDILEDCVIGNNAKSLAFQKIENGIYGLKHLIGRNFDDSKVQKRIKYFPFNISADVSNSIVISFTQNGIIVRKTPQQLLTMYLKKLRAYIEEKLQTYYEKIWKPCGTKVVITVPAYFNVIQRTAIFTAAEDAGFTVSQLLSEPTATALSCCFDKPVCDSSLILVYDMGCGPFEVTVLEIRDNNVTMVATSGETELCGQNFDDCIMDCINAVLKSYYNYDAKNDFSVKKQLLNLCERVKKKLATEPLAKIIVKRTVPTSDNIKVNLRRKLFLQMSKGLVCKSVYIVDNFLKDLKISKESIKAVILSGGSSRLPGIQEQISQYFGAEKLNWDRTGNSVAEGAALQAAMLSQDTRQTTQEFKMTDIVPLSLGFHCLGRMIFVINRNTQIPTKAYSFFYNSECNQTSMLLEIFEGERVDCRLNRLLGTLLVTDVTPAPWRTIQVTATLHIDRNGILSATAYETTNLRSLKVNFMNSNQSERGIRNSLADAIRNASNEQIFIRFVTFKTHLLEYCNNILRNLERLGLTEMHRKAYILCTKAKNFAKDLEVENEDLVKQVITECHMACETLRIIYSFV